MDRLSTAMGKENGKLVVGCAWGQGREPEEGSAAHRVLNSHGDDANKQHDGAARRRAVPSREKFRSFFLFIISLELYRRARLVLTCRVVSLLRNGTSQKLTLQLAAY